MNIAPKTAAVGLGGSLSMILLWIAGLALAHWQITIPPEIAGAFTTLISTVASYYAPRSQHPSDSGQSQTSEVRGQRSEDRGQTTELYPPTTPL